MEIGGIFPGDWLPLAPPVYAVPAGSVPKNCTVPVYDGFGSPFFVMVTLPAKFLPVTAVSTVADLMAVAPSVPLNEKKMSMAYAG